MEFDRNYKEDVNFDSTSLWANHMEPDLLGNEFSIDGCSPNGYFQDFRQFDHISIVGSSSNLEFEVPSPRFERLEAALGNKNATDFEIYEAKPLVDGVDGCSMDFGGNESKPLEGEGDEFTLNFDVYESEPMVEGDKFSMNFNIYDLNPLGDSCSIFDIYESKPFAKDENGIMQNFLNNEFLNHPQRSLVAMVEHRQSEPPSNFQELEPLNYALPDENSCITGDQTSYQDVEFNRNDALVRRRTGKGHRIPRGQWTLEEDR
ncbi:hypothetical protein FRX31_027708 [Thalictrum thalictroides]|uniref:Uncharacterized protein n=1 Tax=Thalictrum thalictroides TaxID=46969 RepID=A0A7J6VCT3_THATH|nr:hypothetical protein FRX31_027708 [Thalictrum thalictroides]